MTSLSLAELGAMSIHWVSGQVWNFMNIETIGFIGAALMVVTLAMKTMIPLRAVGVISSIFQSAFALLAGITPMLIQHSVLLPMNAYRLYEQPQGEQ